MCKQMPGCFSFSQKPQWYFLYQKSLHGTKKGVWGEGGEAQTDLFIWEFIYREFKEDSVNHSCRKSLCRMQESGENVFTSVLSSSSLKFLGDRKSQKSSGIALIQSWSVTRFSHSSSHADSLMQKSWVSLKFSTIHDIYLGFGSSFLFWVFTKQCLPCC